MSHLDDTRLFLVPVAPKTDLTAVLCWLAAFVVGAICGVMLGWLLTG